MTLVTPQMIRATRVALREAATSRAAAAAASSSGSSSHLAFAATGRAAASPLTSTSTSTSIRASSPSPFASYSQSSPFSTSVGRWSEADTQKAKAQEEQSAGEAMGTEQHKPEEEKSSADAAKEEFEKQLVEKDASIKELKDQLLYMKADMQNVQRRAQEEKTQASDYAITKFARDMTSSLDVLALALRSVPEPLRQPAPADTPADDARKVVAELYSGVDLTSKSILDMLKHHGVVSFDPTGEKFNPNEHEAMYQAPIPGKEPGTVLECSKVGFKIKGRILRAAQVGVVQG